MNSVVRDFVSEEPRTFRMKLGHALASSLSGFAAGIIVASIVWLIGTWYFFQAYKIVSYSKPAQVWAPLKQEVNAQKSVSTNTPSSSVPK